eukprot:CAMPEP_0114263918 /NCGR_PEP_ID=MMETSP0058-20121206/22851_1 /TAXON_ID=36894 /ORGANISM="Pyramimonas parkeae, CCMP726" /LENGTH=1306 /DNA_ID=CAMNT_0001380401 /DNA_START=267 /DNA_END=4187 /DNA_ORIENTATION=+
MADEAARTARLQMMQTQMESVSPRHNLETGQIKRQWGSGDRDDEETVAGEIQVQAQAVRGANPTNRPTLVIPSEQSLDVGGSRTPHGMDLTAGTPDMQHVLGNCTTPAFDDEDKAQDFVTRRDPSGDSNDEDYALGLLVGAFDYSQGAGGGVSGERGETDEAEIDDGFQNALACSELELAGAPPNLAATLPGQPAASRAKEKSLARANSLQMDGRDVYETAARRTEEKPADERAVRRLSTRVSNLLLGPKARVHHHDGAGTTNHRRRKSAQPSTSAQSSPEINTDMDDQVNTSYFRQFSKRLSHMGAFMSGIHGSPSRRELTMEEQPRRLMSPTRGKELWQKLRHHVQQDTDLQADIINHRTLFGHRAPDAEVEAIRLRMRSMKRSRFLLTEDHPIRVKWDIAQFFVLIYVAIAVPMRIGFDLEARGMFYVVECMLEVYFYIDILLNFVTSYQDEDNVLVMDLSEIRMHYLKTWFLIDIVSVLPVDTALRIQSGTFVCSFYMDGCAGGDRVGGEGQYFKIVKMLRLVRLVKLLRLMRVGRITNRYKDDMFSALRFMSCLRLIGIMIYLGHIFGCMFYYFSNDEWLTDHEQQLVEDGLFDTWRRDPTLVGASITEKYVATAYWAFTTMTTVGYGDISAKSVAERTFAIVGMIFGGFMLSAIISKLVSIIDESNMEQKALRNKLLGVEQWVKDRGLPKPERIRILNFFRKQPTKPYDERALLMDIPFEMRARVLHRLYKDLINMVPFFTDGDAVFRTELSMMFRPVQLSPGTHIYRRGEIGREMYILATGDVDILGHGNSLVVGVLRRGAYFGEGAVLGDMRRRESLRARSVVLLMAIPQQDMEFLLEVFPEMRVKLSSIYIKRHQAYQALARKDSGMCGSFDNQAYNDELLMSMEVEDSSDDDDDHRNAGKPMGRFGESGGSDHRHSATSTRASGAAETSSSGGLGDDPGANADPEIGRPGGSVDGGQGGDATDAEPVDVGPSSPREPEVNRTNRLSSGGRSRLLAPNPGSSPYAARAAELEAAFARETKEGQGRGVLEIGMMAAGKDVGEKQGATPVRRRKAVPQRNRKKSLLYDSEEAQMFTAEARAFHDPSANLDAASQRSRRKPSSSRKVLERNDGNGGINQLALSIGAANRISNFAKSRLKKIHQKSLHDLHQGIQPSCEKCMKKVCECVFKDELNNIVMDDKAPTVVLQSKKSARFESTSLELDLVTVLDGHRNLEDKLGKMDQKLNQTLRMMQMMTQQMSDLSLKVDKLHTTNVGLQTPKSPTLDVQSSIDGGEDRRARSSPCTGASETKLGIIVSAILL